MQVGLVTFQQLQPLLNLFNVPTERVNLLVRKTGVHSLHIAHAQTV